MKQRNMTKTLALILCMSMLFTICSSFVSFDNSTAYAAATLTQIYNWGLFTERNDSPLYTLSDPYNSDGYISISELKASSKLDEDTLTQYAADFKTKYNYLGVSSWYAGNDFGSGWFYFQITNVTYVGDDVLYSSSNGINYATNIHKFEVVSDTTELKTGIPDCSLSVDPSWGNNMTTSGGAFRFYIYIQYGESEPAATPTPSPSPDPTDTPTPTDTPDPNATPSPEPTFAVDTVNAGQTPYSWRLADPDSDNSYTVNPYAHPADGYLDIYPEYFLGEPTNEQIEEYAQRIQDTYKLDILIYYFLGNNENSSPGHGASAPLKEGSTWAYRFSIQSVEYDETKTQELQTAGENVIMLRVVPNTDYYFNSWHGDCGAWNTTTVADGKIRFWIKVTVADPNATQPPTASPPPTPAPTPNPEDYIINSANHPGSYGGPIVNPSGVTVNLFDYWLEGDEEDPTHKPGGTYGTGNFDVPNTPQNGGSMKSGNPFKAGINNGHLLLFGGGNRFQGWQMRGDKEYVDGTKDEKGKGYAEVNIVGEWNFYTGDRKDNDGNPLQTDHLGNPAGTDYYIDEEYVDLYHSDPDFERGGPRYGIVQNMLENGYPKLNLDNTYDRPDYIYPEGATYKTEYGVKDLKLLPWQDFNATAQPWVYFGMSDYYDGSTWWVGTFFDKPGFYHKSDDDKDATETVGISERSDKNGVYFDYNNPTSSVNFQQIDGGLRSESLAYLFNPDIAVDYRSVYTDVRDMFRLDRKGYYYYNAADEDDSKGRLNAYGYMNPEQQTDEETGEKYYKMELYDTPYGTQFFPFDRWEKSFEYVYDDNGEPVYDDDKPVYDANGKPTTDSEGNPIYKQAVKTNGYENENITPYAHKLNHFFGMTLTADFRQPLNGLVNKDHMIFDFSGDDDVWIFVDDVLVGDVGGVHSKIDINIDFATGDVTTWDREWTDDEGKRTEEDVTSLYEQFRYAYRNDTLYPPLQDILNGVKDVPDGWEINKAGDNLVFKVGTTHELKFFYMERGHNESNLSLSYNFPEFWPGRLHKVDEDGNELDGAEFILYPAEYVGTTDENGNSTLTADEINAIINDPEWDSQWYHKVDEFKISGDAIATDIKPEYQDPAHPSLLTHYAQMLDADGLPIAYSQRFYILREETTPTGYRSVKDTVLEYHEKTGTLTAVNRYETGVYASFMAKWIGSAFTRTADTIPFANYNPCDIGNMDDGNGNLIPDPAHNPFPTDANEGVAHATDLAEGLTIIVPTIRQLDGKNGEENPNKNLWYPMYGSNTAGWHTIFPGDEDTADWDDPDPSKQYVQIADPSKPALMTALITAAFLQMYDDNTREWYLEWSDTMQRLEGFMENLPGNSTRYLRVNLESTALNENADLNLVPLFIPRSALEAIVYTDGKTYPGDLSDEELQALMDTRDNCDSLSDVLYGDLKAFIQTQGGWFDSDGDPIIANIKAYLENLYAGDGENDGLRSIDMLDNSSFGERQYRTVIYVPNERRELRIRKVDENGNYINGAVFAVFDTSAEAYNFGLEHEDDEEFTSAAKAIEALAADGRPLSYGMTDTVTLDTVATPQEGTLIFRGGDTANGIIDNEQKGISYIGWNSSRIADDDDAKASGVGDNIYWIKEIYAPMGYDRNTNLIRVEIGDAAVLANATGYKFVPTIDSTTGQPKTDDDGKVVGGPQLLTPENGKDTVDDGIIVRAALGKLAQTLTKFAMGDNVNVTLRDITAFKQTQTGGTAANPTTKGETNGQLDTSQWYEEDKDPDVEHSNEYAYKFNLHFGKNALDLTGQYGRHDMEDAQLPIFEAEDGYIRVMPRQNLDDVSHYLNSDHIPYTAYDILKKPVVDEKTGETVMEPFDLEGLFTLMNIVVVEDATRPAILELSKKVEDNRETKNPPTENDSYKFGISLKTAAGDNLEAGAIYDAYIHPTNHEFDVLDEYGNETGETRPCIHADSGHTPMYVYIDTDGSCKFMTNKDADTSVATNLLDAITLKDGETFVILNLPQGAKFGIGETIFGSNAGDYTTEISVDEETYLSEQKFEHDDDERTSSGALNVLSTDEENTEEEIHPVKVLYLNRIGTLSVDPDPGNMELPEAGGAGTLMVCMLGCLMFITAYRYLRSSGKKKTRKQTL